MGCTVSKLSYGALVLSVSKVVGSDTDRGRDNDKNIEKDKYRDRGGQRQGAARKGREREQTFNKTIFEKENKVHQKIQQTKIAINKCFAGREIRL